MRREMFSTNLIQSNYGDLNIIVPHQGYADRIQEIHTMIIHIMIRGIEELMAKV